MLFNPAKFNGPLLNNVNGSMWLYSNMYIIINGVVINYIVINYFIAIMNDIINSAKIEERRKPKSDDKKQFIANVKMFLQTMFGADEVAQRIKRKPVYKLSEKRVWQERHNKRFSSR